MRCVDCFPASADVVFPGLHGIFLQGAWLPHTALTGSVGCTRASRDVTVTRKHQCAADHTRWPTFPPPVARTQSSHANGCWTSHSVVNLSSTISLFSHYLYFKGIRFFLVCQLFLIFSRLYIISKYVTTQKLDSPCVFYFLY